MISLLPPLDRKELNAARANTLLIRYVFLVLALIGFLLLELIVVYAFLKTDQTSKEAEVRENEQKAIEYASVKKEATEFSTNLKMAAEIMKKQVPYVAILREFSNTMPANTVIERIEVSSATIGVPNKLNIKARSRDDVLAFKNAFNNSKYFGDASIQQINEQEGRNGEYPVAADITVTFKKELLELEDI